MEIFKRVIKSTVTFLIVVVQLVKGDGDKPHEGEIDPGLNVDAVGICPR